MSVVRDKAARDEARVNRLHGVTWIDDEIAHESPCAVLD
jgi:hypothetical protein